VVKVTTAEAILVAIKVVAEAEAQVLLVLMVQELAVMAETV
jgi:hypothetical protein